MRPLRRQANGPFALGLPSLLCRAGRVSAIRCLRCFLWCNCLGVVDDCEFGTRFRSCSSPSCKRHGTDFAFSPSLLRAGGSWMSASGQAKCTPCSIGKVFD